MKILILNKSPEKNAVVFKRIRILDKKKSKSSGVFPELNKYIKYQLICVNFIRNKKIPNSDQKSKKIKNNIKKSHLKLSPI